LADSAAASRSCAKIASALIGCDIQAPVRWAPTCCGLESDLRMMMWRGLRAGASAAGRPQRTAIRLLSSNEKVFPRNEQVPRTGQLRLLDLDGKPLGVMEAEAAHTLRAERQ
jgi:hypothetical protein